LSSRQSEIDKALSGLVAELGKKTNWRESTVFRILRLQNLRYRIAPLAPAQGQNGGDLIAKYGKVLIKARATISGWSGRLVFVSLPYPPRFFTPNAP
jgi:hypothetical protein